nr:PREDICTED: uncharacterized protein LOC109039891 [Bemisia tabaci]XP_018911147.1 PREDICTED: uncharacterized protein LOC109039891 [Bemisia tabaci]
MADFRIKRLTNLFYDVVKGKKTVNSNNANLFLEAVTHQSGAVQILSRIVASEHALQGLLLAFSSDTSLEFLNGPLTSFLMYIKDPELQTLCGGAVVRKLVGKLMEAPLTFKSFVKEAKSQTLNEKALCAFAWLLLQLLTLPTVEAISYLPVAEDPAIQRALINSTGTSSYETRTLGQRIIKIANTLAGSSTSKNVSLGQQGPGGRHDNDFAEIHNISIYPTSDELRTKSPFLPRACDVQQRAHESDGLANHIDWQFRLLREDMLRDLREELAMWGQPKKRRRLLVIENLSMAGIQCDQRTFWSLMLRCRDELPPFKNLKPNERKQFLKDNPKFLRNGFLACLFVGNDFITLGTLVRDENLLTQLPTVLCIQLPPSGIEKVLLQLKEASSGIRLLQVDTAIFSYEPILTQLKEMRELSLGQEIVAWKVGDPVPPPDYNLSEELLDLMEHLYIDCSHDLQSYLRLQNSTKLDQAQAECFLTALQQKVTVIQGPPGTGKSFIGSLIGKAIYQWSTEKILIVCYTHHALDEFVKDLLNLGIPDQEIVRLGSVHKAKQQTKSLALKELRQTMKLTREQYNMISAKKLDVTKYGNDLYRAFGEFAQFNPNHRDLLGFLEFADEDLPFFSAFKVPEDEDGYTFVTRSGDKVNDLYLVQRWANGQDAGIFRDKIPRYCREVWSLPNDVRFQKCRQWYQELAKERAKQVRETGNLYNDSIGEVDKILLEKDLAVIRSKRIIACTTTAAAKYSEAIQCISPGVLLVEEAGEILESHVLTALGPSTKHLILIGDHKQLRPKVSYELSVERGLGYDLNRSLFERLILKGFPHHTLYAQHRMRPEISAFVREMTYPELKDAKDTEGRPNLRGFTDNIIFVNHSELETELTGFRELCDSTATSSKQNRFEANMTLKCVRYLGQQGYRSDEIVVLTPYLGQLRLLYDVLKAFNDPVLNDLDSHDLVRAGLMPDASAQISKPGLRISTIDNFQGEEAKIIVASLTRSNASNDIGFMYAPERLNVLISRARDALILIGNAEHFMGSRKGGDLWTRFIGMLKAGNHVYDGFPVHCERHPDRSALLKKPIDFDLECPDGGCKEPCDKTLNCGIHKCPDKCHLLHDHSKIKCTANVTSKCPKGHVNKRRCHAQKPDVCKKCDIEEEKARKAADRKVKEQEEEVKHLLKMADLDLEIQRIKDEAALKEAEKQREAALRQKEKELQLAKEMAQKKLASNINQQSTPAPVNQSVGAPSAPVAAGTGQPQPKSKPGPLSGAEADWERQKKLEGASNDAIDALMKLTGLEAVKEKMLDIKTKIETAALQGTDVKKERFSVTMLGNPGTGKTTVARIYGQFLASVNAIPGAEFVEITGASLANDGVAGAKKKIQELVKAGGGVFFLDEAYQLASGNNYGGAAVLDYLLAEIEEQRGTIVFILAGYKKEMEKFFEHNPGFASRVPHQLDFVDYSDEDLLKMLGKMIETKYNGRAKLEGGLDGLYARILIKRQGRQRGSRNYGNARDLENTWARVTERQAARFRKERREGANFDPLLFTKADIIGPEPSDAVKNSAAWRKLQELIGLESVKRAVAGFVKQIEVNYARELAEEEPLQVSLNRLFLGSPGTGKTTVAKLYGAILADLGLLSKGEVVCKGPADFVGAVLGESEKNTKAILAASTGKVLLIDEAYGLSPVTGNIGSSGGGDIYKTAVIDTIVAEVQSTPGEDRCVLLLGYTDLMKDMLKNANPGLKRRFPLESAFVFEDYDDEALRKILEQKLKAQGLKATDKAKDVAINLLSRLRDQPNFGNAGEVENLLSRAKDNWQKRQMDKDITDSVIFEPEDFDEKHDRAQKSDLSVKELFSDIVGLEQLKDKLEGYQKMTVNLKRRKKEPRMFIPYNYVFKGPPGTGKTTVARRIAQFYYNIGILPTNEYTDCSAADLVAAYVGQTALKTKETLRSALGKVLFIDEAYRLADDHFGKEAINEIVDCLTKPDFIGRIVVILAGYTDDMNQFLKVNPGLASRFPEEVFFESMQPKQCIELLHSQLLKSDLEVETDIYTPNVPGYRRISERFSELRKLPSWGNGRDVITLAKKIVGTAFRNADPSIATIKVTSAEVLQALNAMLVEQTARSMPNTSVRNIQNKPFNLPVQSQNNTFAPPKITTSSSVKTACPTACPPPEPEEEVSLVKAKKQSDGRDPGVSDAVWQQLQLDMQAQKKREEQAQAEIQQQEKMLQEAQQKLKEALEQFKLEAEKVAEKVRGEEEARRLQELEKARIRAIQLKRAQEEEERRLQALREAQQRERQREQEAQKKLRQMGVCPVGYRWIKQSSGYRCAGGSHFVSDQQLGF